MKHLFLEVQYTGEMHFPEELAQKTPNTITLAGSIQYLNYLPKLKAFLESKGKTVYLFESRHGQYPGQVLGCDIFKFQAKDENKQEQAFEAFVYLGDGLFHPTALLFSNQKDVIIYNPMSKKIETLDKNYLAQVEKKKKIMLAKFLTSKNIGLLVTRKPGQNQSKATEYFREEMRKRVEQGEEKKNIFVFLADHIDTSSLENFNFIDVWINTACPRIVQDFHCLNLRDLQEINYFSGKAAQF